MTKRPNPRKNLSLERLENREVLTAGGPTAQMQEMLEWVNLARVNPSQTANLITNDLTTDNLGATLQNFNVNLGQVKNTIASETPAQPLAWSDNLAAAAQYQSNYQANKGVQTHDGGPGLSLPIDRITNVNIGNYANPTSNGENAFAYADDMKNAMEAFLVDWGNDSNGDPHRANLYEGSYHDVGFGVTATNNNGLGPLVVTQDFASQAGEKADLLGVAFNDNNGDGIYEAGEGVANLSIDVTDAKGNTQTIQTWDAGGYQIALDPGQYTVTARMGARVFSTQQVAIGSQNLHLDFVLTNAWQDATTPVAAPVPVVAVPVVVAPVIAAPVVAIPVVVVVPVATPTPAPVAVAIPTPAPAPVVAEAAPAPVVAPTPVPAATLATSSTTDPALMSPIVTSATAPATATVASQETSLGGAPTEGQDTSMVGTSQEATSSDSSQDLASSNSSSSLADPLNSVMGLQWQTWDGDSSGGTWS